MQDDDIKKELLQDDAVRKLMKQVDDLKKGLKKAALIVGLLSPSDDKRPDGE